MRALVESNFWSSTLIATITVSKIRPSLSIESTWLYEYVNRFDLVTNPNMNPSGPHNLRNVLASVTVGNRRETIFKQRCNNDYHIHWKISNTSIHACQQYNSKDSVPYPGGCLKLFSRPCVFSSVLNHTRRIVFQRNSYRCPPTRANKRAFVLRGCKLAPRELEIPSMAQT